ncbi:EstA family serine hydrolase [Streptantibioticus cattleyicolor]|uniref:Putative esterase n=1 Tax=Streptantibioticus cattleyicolor (strain ATCC 35852 / DSM 46488 / JCM 4925 / NBRC 14057 / NRRL 8057) TaxID=1003195 RepID=F8JLC9_STREN|nr:EstA family serine hydrolase [Streptantibioticus cattleyicolor]AEW99581.1 putative esterase [Streptantibioticus cattleyicolor NRRL 8057 = DSM 46488]CCB71381.1 Penicillin-binding protein, beta-lactamase class C [Streptantibioticus cattleyicolor NRRL 8057 = DSM 46488]
MPEHDTPRGTVAEGFEPVRDAFAAAVRREGGDLAAQVVAYWHGERVVDLWTGPEITGDSLLGAYSASKGAAHLIVALLVQEGVLDLDERVSHYWPEFAAEGKREITLRELLAHRAGLVGADTGFTPDELADDRVVAARLARQRPYWRPGTAFGYHALVAAALTGEVVRRATGRTVQELFAERVRDVYGVDFHLGLPADQEPRFLTAQPPLATPERLAALSSRATGPHSLPGIAFNRNHPDNPELWTLPNLRTVRALGPASFGGVASARGLARMYAIAIDSVDGLPPLLTPDTTAAFAQIHSIGHELVTREHKAFTAGFHATSELYPSLGQGAFGHSGAGGQQAFADPRNAIAYGYTRRRFPFPNGPAPENAPLVHALHTAVDRLR